MMPTGSVVLFVDLEPRHYAVHGCSEPPKAIPASLATVEGVPLEHIARVRERRPDLLLLRAASARVLTETVRVARPICPCFGILCWEDVETEELHSCFAAGLDDFVCCPFPESVLVARVGRLIDQCRKTDAGEEAGTRQFGSLVAVSPGLCKLLSVVPMMARSSATVLITGETGTGKELMARAIHYESSRKSRPFVPINCGALPDHLFENELFGHARGAFTDASSSEEGLLGEAEGGTLFLDEIDALSLVAQAKTLRLLEDGEYRPLGSAKIRHAHVRIIAASNADLRRLVAARAFRDDLYHRLNVLTLHIPPLRERAEDIPALARHFLSKYGAESIYGSIELAPNAVQKLMSHDWPGNVRELERTIQRTAILAPAAVLEADHLDLPGRATVTSTGHSFQEDKRETVTRFERSYLSALMAVHAGNVSRAARAAGKERRSFQRLLRKHGLGTGAFGCGETAPRPAATLPHS